MANGTTGVDFEGVAPGLTDGEIFGAMRGKIERINEGDSLGQADLDVPGWFVFANGRTLGIFDSTTVGGVDLSVVGTLVLGISDAIVLGSIDEDKPGTVGGRVLGISDGKVEGDIDGTKPTIGPEVGLVAVFGVVIG